MNPQNAEHLGRQSSECSDSFPHFSTFFHGQGHTALLAQRSLELVEDLSPRMLVMTLLGLSSAVGQMEDRDGAPGAIRGPSGGPYGAVWGPYGAIWGIEDGIKIEHHQNVNEHLVTSSQCNCATGMKHTGYQLL